MKEGAPAAEVHKEPTKAEAVASLKKDPEDRSVLDAYVAERQKDLPTRKSEFMLQLELGQIYHEAGLEDAAADTLRTAKQQAIKEGEHDSYIKLMEAINQMGIDPKGWEPDPSP